MIDDLTEEIFSRLRNLEVDLCFNCGEYDCGECEGSPVDILEFLDSEDFDEEALEHLTVDCPECESMEDDQYTCTTCWSEGGNGKIRVPEFLKENYPELLLRRQK